MRFLLLLLLLIPLGGQAAKSNAKKTVDPLCALSIAEAYTIHRAAHWIGTPFPEIRFYFFLSLFQESEVALVREAKSLEMLEDPFTYLRNSPKGIKVISENEFQMPVGQKTLSFSRNVTESEKNLVRKSLHRFSYQEIGFLRVTFSDGAQYESDSIFEGPVDRIDINPVVVATCHDRIMSRVQFGNPVRRIEMVHTHMVDPLLIHQPNGAIIPSFAYPQTEDNADLVFMSYFRHWLQGRAHAFANGKSTLYELSDLRKPALRKKFPNLVEALEKMQAWNAGDATLAVTATIGTRIPSLFKFTYEE